MSNYLERLEKYITLNCSNINLIKYNYIYELKNYKGDTYLYLVKYSLGNNKKESYHSRTDYIREDITDEELFKLYKYPKYQWLKVDTNKIKRKLVDEYQNNFIDFVELFSEYKVQYEYNNLKLKRLKNQFYISYQKEIDNQLYQLKTKPFSIEDGVDFLKNEFQQKYL